MKFLPFPEHYKERNCYDHGYIPNINADFQKKANIWRKKHNIKNAAADSKKIKILSIDNQRDFNFPEGSMYVAGRTGTGAMDAQKNTVEFIYKNLNRITDIISTLDTHYLNQIFFSICHLDQNNENPEPGTVISHEDYKTGKFRANPAIAKDLGCNPVLLNKQYTYYCGELEKDGKYQLMIWPYHCLFGSPGNSLSGVIDEAIRFHSLVRRASDICRSKGESPYTENYSIFAPEVKTFYDGSPLPKVSKNFDIIKTLIDSDVVVILGQAASHCVKESVKDLLNEIKSHNRDLLDKVYILKDCTSAVVIPGVFDFTDIADKAMAEFENEGMHIVESTTLMEDWPNIKL